MRKHHNKLYFGKYDHKTIFKMPYANVLYPTTDEHLYSILKGEQDDTKFHGLNGNVVKLSDDSKRVASFILANGPHKSLRNSCTYLKRQETREGGQSGAP